MLYPWLLIVCLAILSQILLVESNLVMYADDPSNIRLAAETKQLIRQNFSGIIDVIPSDLRYPQGQSFSYSMQSSQPKYFPETNTTRNLSVYFSLHFYNESSCGETLGGSGIETATSDELRTAFRARLDDVLDLVDQSFPAGYSIAGQFQVGYYVEGTKQLTNGCTNLLVKSRSPGFCSGYKHMMLSHTIFDRIYAGCFMQSVDLVYILRLDDTCNAMVIDNATSSLLWSTRTANSGGRGCYLVMQTDMNLVLYDGTNGSMPYTAVWNSGTRDWKDGSAAVLLQPDGNLVLYNVDDVQRVLWQSNSSKSSDNSQSIPTASNSNSSLYSDLCSHISCEKSRLPALRSVILSGAIFSLALLMSFLLWKSRNASDYERLRKDKRHVQDLHEDDEAARWLVLEGKPEKYTYAELKIATRGFHTENKIGGGGFGDVYKGTFLGGTLVAIKKLKLPEQQAHDEFLNELSSISSVQHKYLLKLLGYCCEGEHRLLVHEYMENNSLSHALLDGNMHIDWSKRYEMCVDIARGISYLHEESRSRIVHRDIKASNILLDKDLCPRIADFGLAKLVKDGCSHLSTRVAGTFGYMDSLQRRPMSTRLVF